MHLFLILLYQVDEACQWVTSYRLLIATIRQVIETIEHVQH